MKIKEAFLLNYIFEYLKELSDDYGIELVFTHTANLKM